MAIDVEAAAQKMIEAAADALGKAWKKARAFGEPEFKKIALSIATIEAARATDEITKEEARALLDIQKNASRAVLTASKVIGLAEAEKAINAALAVLTKPLTALMGRIV